MALYLVQHGIANPKDQDPERRLSEKGKEQTALIADTAANYRVSVTMIEHSGKARAQETADIFASRLHPKKGTVKRDGINPMDAVTAVASEIEPTDDLMLVGHLPFMQKLASFLITGSQEPAVIKFQNSGIVYLDKDPDSGAWHIKWTLMPVIE